MDTMNLNAELFRELSYIADDESSMKKLLEYVKNSNTADARRPERLPFHRLSWRKMLKNIAR